MIEPRPSVLQFVRAVVGEELVRHPDVHVSVIVERVTVRLHSALVKLIGASGFGVILARAIFLASRDHPALAGIEAGQDGALSGLGDDTRDPASVQEGAPAIVAYFMELLVMLVGEDLAMHLVRDIWPSVVEEKK